MLGIFAYLDAGTGSIIIQAAIGLVAGVSYFFRHHVASFFSKISSRFSKKTKKAEE